VLSVLLVSRPEFATNEHVRNLWLKSLGTRRKFIEDLRRKILDSKPEGALAAPRYCGRRRQMPLRGQLDSQENGAVRKRLTRLVFGRRRRHNSHLPKANQLVRRDANLELANLFKPASFRSR
jgi:hypothetical protein